MSVVGAIILVVIVGIVLMYAFCGPMSFVFYFLGVLYSSFMFPLELVKRIIYPVGLLPSLVWCGGIMFLSFILIARLIRFFTSR